MGVAVAIGGGVGEPQLKLLFIQTFSAFGPARCCGQFGVL